jgi:hypothetical protein
MAGKSAPSSPLARLHLNTDVKGRKDGPPLLAILICGRVIFASVFQWFAPISKGFSEK